MKRKIFAKILALLFAVVTITGCGSSAQNDNPPRVITGGIAGGFGYSDEGFIFANEDRLLRYYDLKSGEKTVLCARPDCKHERVRDGERECYADYQGYAETAFMYGGKLYVIARQSTGSAADIFNKTLYVSDPGGTNRQTLAELENVGFIYGCTANDNFLAITSYIDMGSVNIIGSTDASSELENAFPDRCVVLTTIDLGSGKTKRLQFERDFEVASGTPWVENGSVTFQLNYLTEDLFAGVDEKRDELTEEEFNALVFEIGDKMQDCLAAELVRYDPKVETTENLWTGYSVDGIDHGYALTSDKDGRHYVIDLSDGSAEALDEKFNGYSGDFCDSGIMLCKYERGAKTFPAYFYDFKTKTISEKGVIPANCNVISVGENIVYTLCFDDGGSADFYGWASKEDFFGGKTDSTEKLNRLGDCYDFN